MPAGPVVPPLRVPGDHVCNNIVSSKSHVETLVYCASCIKTSSFLYLAALHSTSSVSISLSVARLNISRQHGTAASAVPHYFEERNPTLRTRHIYTTELQDTCRCSCNICSARFWCLKGLCRCFCDVLASTLPCTYRFLLSCTHTMLHFCLQPPKEGGCNNSPETILSL